MNQVFGTKYRVFFLIILNLFCTCSFTCFLVSLPKNKGAFKFLVGYTAYTAYECLCVLSGKLYVLVTYLFVLNIPRTIFFPLCLLGLK